jgi:hypothetical protein
MANTKSTKKIWLWLWLAFITPAIVLYLCAAFVTWSIPNIATWSMEARGMYLLSSLVFGLVAATDVARELLRDN